MKIDNIRAYPKAPGGLQSQSNAPSLKSATIETNAFLQKPNIRKSKKLWLNALILRYIIYQLQSY